MSVICIDCGSHTTRIGVCGETEPRATLRSLVGVPRLSTGTPTYGIEAIRNRRAFRAETFVSNGVITSLSHAESFFQHSLNLLDVPSSPILMTEPFRNPRKTREALTTSFFETLHVPSLYFSLQPVLDLFAADLANALIVDSGASSTQIVPLYEGFIIPAAVERQFIGGNDLLDYLVTTLSKENNVSLTSSVAREFIETKVKQDCFCVSGPQEMQHCSTDLSLDREYTLPDGTHFVVGDERFLSCELLFHPDLFINDDALALGLDKAAHNCLLHCPVDTRATLRKNVLCVGGNTMFPGFPDRLQTGLETLSSNQDVVVIAPEDRDILTWIGGSILGGVSTFEQLCISRAEYDEVGSAIVQTKCPPTWD